jgi:hypothetical protein
MKQSPAAWKYLFMEGTLSRLPIEKEKNRHSA